jgi:cytochrome c556
MSKTAARFQNRNHALTFPKPPRRRLNTLALVLGLLLLPVFGALAQSGPRPEALIKWRQSAFQVIAWNSGRIKSALGDKYDSREVRSAANALSAIANSGLSDLFAPGTAHGKGWRETSASAAVFGDAPSFRALSDRFADETTELARLAGAADQQAVARQFSKVAQTCKTCHDKFRETD